MTHSGMVRIVRVLAAAMVDLPHGSIQSYWDPPMMILKLVYAPMIAWKMFSSKYLKCTSSEQI